MAASVGRRPDARVIHAWGRGNQRRFVGVGKQIQQAAARQLIPASVALARGLRCVNRHHTTCDDGQIRRSTAAHHAAEFRL